MYIFVLYSFIIYLKFFIMSIEELQKEINQFNNSPIANMTDEQIDALTKENEERQFRQEVLNLLRQINEKLVRLS